MVKSVTLQVTGDQRSEATVTYEKDVVTIEQMSQAVAQYGFTATPKAPSSG